MKTYEHLTLYLVRDRVILNKMRKDIKEKLKTMPELLSIGEVAEIFSIHQDTLRNWEKDGILVPLRVGKRGDRKYRPQDIEVIVDKMGSKLTLPQLESFLWKSADILRGKIDSSDYKKYIFGLLFYKRMSDVWDEEYADIKQQFKNHSSKIMLARADYNHRFQVPIFCRWSEIQNQAENIGVKLNEIFDALANANSPKLDKIFEDLDFANKDRFPNETLQRLINHFSQYNFGNTYISSDLLGDAYEYLIKQFAADAGKKGGEFYTPREVEKIIMGILKPHEKDHIYDPTVGSGGFLLEAYDYLKQKSGEKLAKSLYLYGQEQNLATFAIAKINMFLHGLDSADIRRGDTLANPQFLNQQGGIQTFDIVVANPPYSIKDWEYEAFKTKFGRLDGYDAPPDKNADYAFVLHIIKSMNQNGRAGIVLPHGVLFRGGAEGRIREQILKNDILETIIALPAKLFYGTGIPAAILILNKNKSKEKKGKLLIIDAEKDFLEGKNQNSLRSQDISKIIKTHNSYENLDKYARIVDMKEIQNNNYNLNIRQYIDSSKVEEMIDIKTVRNEIKVLKKELAEVDSKVEIFLDKLNY
jgi:type I restriction enzyme M protein